MGKNNSKHFDKKNSSRRKQEYIPLDGDALLKQLQAEKQSGETKRIERVYEMTQMPKSKK